MTAIDKDGNKAGTTFIIIPEAIVEATTEATAEDKLDEATSSNWGTYILIGVGALILGLLVFWLGRKTAYH